MKVVFTVTAVYDFPDDVDVEDLVEGEDSLGKHIVVKGHKFQPIIDFLPYDEDEDEDDDESGEDELQEIFEEINDHLRDEEYQIIKVDD
jgi:hypothetical protein